MKILILGHINCRNKGDESVLIGLLNGLSGTTLYDESFVGTEDLKYDSKFVPNRIGKMKISLIESYTTRTNIPIVDRLRILLRGQDVQRLKNTPIIKVKSLIPSCDTVLISAKDLFSEHYGQNSFTKWVELLECAVTHNQNVYLWAGSYGPFSQANKERIKPLLDKIKLVTCRETISLNYMTSLTNTRCLCTPDPAYLLKKKMPYYYKHHPDKKCIGFSISDGLALFKHVDKKKLLLRCRDDMSMLQNKYNMEILIIPHVFVTAYPGNNDYVFACQLKAEAAKIGLNLKIPPKDLGAGEYKYLIGTCDYFIGMRTHATIAALSQGVPTIGIAYGIKTPGMFNDFYGSTEYVININDYISYGLENIFANMVGNNEVLKHRLSTTAARITQETVDAFNLITASVKRENSYS